MPHVHNIGSQFVQQVGEGAVHLPVAVPVPRPGHVYHVQCNPAIRRVPFPLHRVLGQESVFLPGEDVHLVALRQRLAQALGVHLRTGVVPHGITVDYLQDFHGNTALCGGRLGLIVPVFPDLLRRAVDQRWEPADFAHP